MSVPLRLASACLSLVLVAVLATPAHADGYERVLNGTFDGTKSPWWSSGNTPSRVEDEQLCADVPAGTVNPWDSMIGQNDIPLEADQPYTLRFTASASVEVTIRTAVQLAHEPHTGTLDGQVALTGEPRTFEFTGTSTVASRHAQLSFQTGGATRPYTFCVDDVSLTGGVIPPGGGRDFGTPVRVNQHGYHTSGPKRASIVDSSTRPVPWTVRDGDGTIAAKGRTRVRGDDPMSGDHVHIADFSRIRETGSGYTLSVGAEVSEPFDILENPYDALRRDALAYFYHSRSGLPIESKYVGADYARPAGHVGVAPNTGDTEVPCLPGTCDYTLDVRGGWYDAGDHGKYVVNGALAAWQLMDLHERSLRNGDVEGVRDGLLRIPERHNGVPDILDEARWQVEFLLRMQVPEGEPLAGMVHHKIHDAAWTSHPTLPHEDPQPRYLHPPSTAATLNLAAAGAQCARIWRFWDREFAERCRTAAETAWNAALAHPDHHAPAESVGGGPYDDTDVRDEISWAAAELYATTGERDYLRFVDTELTKEGFFWKETGGLADLTIVRLPFRFPLRQYLAARKRVLGVADEYVRDLRDQGYPNPSMPEDGAYAWGSNSATTTSMVIMATAYDLSRKRTYRDAVLESMDYLLGRNALNQSFISGYGERASHNQHHRHWANQVDPALPTPPPGAMAGGPNSSLQDPVAQQNLRGCAPATCYIDDIGSWSTNEVAINWNSSLAWVAAFADSL
ncbi:glycoside hydrolase family 9 protein [Amycolatopsis cihanbeyliensis]|uniref:Endoglucanase n=1 Tax=Amycolatopsis cihanbeyliensis TaxID=1128664 RepID=A0A542DQ85_AMYCI|nr:glycoside hydrolase family 9 protein [Amycolatopsis cihanbeyliensis]TQJ05216.1 endoglucanase [Amycolatopsis cihanbeyliensis]